MMHLLLLLPIIIALLIIALWSAGVWYLNDFSVPGRQLHRFKQVLVVFPHPDDETNVAGLVWQLRRLNIPTTLSVLTTGECGTPDAHLEPSLKQIRSAEMRKVCGMLGITTLLQEDFGDGQIARNRRRVHRYLEKLLDGLKPDLVITYDLAGMYGHEDHITCSEILTDLVKQKYPETALWYSAMPKHLLRASKLPTHMAKDPRFADQRALANMRIPVGRGVIAKVRSVYMHKSQRQSFQKSSPAHLPIWFVHSMFTNEYFEKVQ